MITSPDMLPEALRKWDIIPVTANELSAEAYEHENISLASIAIDINVLSIDEDKVIVNKAEKGVIELLERHGFTPIPVSFRHGLALGGAFHCVTLDVRRRGDANTSSTIWVQGRLWNLSAAAAEPFSRFGTAPRAGRVMSTCGGEARRKRDDALTWLQGRTIMPGAGPATDDHGADPCWNDQAGLCRLFTVLTENPER